MVAIRNDGSFFCSHLIFSFRQNLLCMTCYFLAETTYAIKKNREIINELHTDLKQ